MANTNLHKSLPAIFAGVILILVAQGVLASETFTVLNTNDDGPGSKTGNRDRQRQRWAGHHCLQHPRSRSAHHCADMALAGDHRAGDH